jgi:hypothetical protein
MVTVEIILLAIGPFSEGFKQGYADGESRDQPDYPRS